MFVNTVQPLYNSHPWESIKVAVEGGDCSGEVKYIVKLHFGDIENWLLQGSSCCWEVTVVEVPL